MKQLNIWIPDEWVDQIEKIAVSEGIKMGKPLSVVDFIRLTLQRVLLLPGEYIKNTRKQKKG